MNNLFRCFALSITLIAFLSVKSQTKYWVRLTDKNGTPYSISNPSAFLTQNSVLRRAAYNIPVHYSDLPVTPSYISQVAGVSGVTVHYASKWLNGLVVSVTNTAAINTINSFSFVSSTSVVNKYKLTLSPQSEEFVNALNKAASAPATFNYGMAYWQNKQIGADCMHNQGYRGQGITIAVLDAGFSSVDVMPVFDSLRARGGILGTRDFVSGGTQVYDDNAHGTGVLSCMAAIKPGVIIGSAPRAEYWLLRTEDVNSEKIVEEYNWIRGAEFADSVGADILTTSLGYTTFDNPAQNHSYSTLDGKTAPMSIAATMAARKGMIVLNAAGNEGCGSPSNCWYYIGVPADADSIIAVGAIDSLYNVASFSSRGPSFDGRIKPDLVARGANAFVCYPGGCTYGNGTSFATPVLAGGVACVWQKYKYRNNMRVIDSLKKTASHANSPDNNRGWGTPNLCAVDVGLPSYSDDIRNFTVFPNPFLSSFGILLPSLPKSGLTVKIYNAFGQEVSQFSMSKSHQEIRVDADNLPVGIYFVHLSSAEATYTRKLIKTSYE